MSDLLPVTILDTNASEEGTYAIDDIQFLDSQDPPVAVTPEVGSVTWCLTDKNGTIINSREDVPITSASSMTIVLSGDDLAISGNADKYVTRNGVIIEQYQRHVLVQGLVDTVIGTETLDNTPVTKEFIFYIENIVCL
ncbi:hypothetical protein LCGC14_1075830 [marine sediment metagenome]|uniref:Uncharacterized protein n=1 Tax=marine sediment metagenome TaxID=412755 RepID=A0A0F9N443_9ZZZZ